MPTLEKMDRSYIEASLDLGAGQIRAPSSRSSFRSRWPRRASVGHHHHVFIPALGSFLIPDLLGGTDSQLIGNVIERQFKSANDWPFGAALSFLLMYMTFFALALRAVVSGRKRGWRQMEAGADAARGPRGTGRCAAARGSGRSTTAAAGGCA